MSLIYNKIVKIETDTIDKRDLLFILEIILQSLQHLRNTLSRSLCTIPLAGINLD